MASDRGIRCMTRRLGAAVGGLCLLAGFWSAAAFARGPLDAAASIAPTEAAPVVRLVQPTTASTTTAATPVVQTALPSGANATTATTTTTLVTTTAVPVLGMVSQTVDSVSESLPATSRTTESAVTLVRDDLAPNTRDAVTTTRAPEPRTRAKDAVAGAGAGISPVVTGDQSPAPAPAASTRFASATRSGTTLANGASRSAGRPQAAPRLRRPRTAPSAIIAAPISGDAGELPLQPSRRAPTADRSGSVPLIPVAPGGLLPGASASGGSGGSSIFVAALVAALLLPVPRLGRRLRLAVPTRPLPIQQLSLERPG
jgi:hypothetical protein